MKPPITKNHVQDAYEKIRSDRGYLPKWDNLTTKEQIKFWKAYTNLEYTVGWLYVSNKGE
jgi:hypothetical protein